MIESIQEVVNTYQQNEFGKLELITELWTIILYDRNFSSGQFEQTMEEIKLKYPEVYSNLIDKYDQKPLKNINEAITEDDYQSELVQLKNNFALERIENLKKIGKKVYPQHENQSYSVSETGYVKPKVIRVDVEPKSKTVEEHIENLKQNVKENKATIAILGVGAVLGVGVVGVIANSSKNKKETLNKKQNLDGIQKNKKRRKK